MGKLYDSYAQALAEDTVCQFEFPFSFEIPLPSISLPIPDFGLSLPTIPFYCPLD